MEKKSNVNDHFVYIFWFIVMLTAFGMGLTIFLQCRFTGQVAERFADVSLIFWLSTAVGGGIGYLIGSSMNKQPPPPPTQPPGTITSDITATITAKTDDDKK